MPRNVRLAIIVLALILVFCVALVWFTTEKETAGLDCETLAVTTPEPPPVYPGSELIEQGVITDREWQYWYEVQYEVDAPPENVTDYYASTLSPGKCWNTDDSGNFKACSGSALPAGEYRVQIDHRAPHSTTYLIHVSLTRCYVEY